MICRKVMDQLSAYLDGELKPDEAGQIRAHLDSCAGCSVELQALERTRDAVKTLPQVRAPANLRAKVLAELDHVTIEHSPVRLPKWRVYWPAAAAIMVAVILWVFNKGFEISEKSALERPVAVTATGFDKELPSKFTSSEEETVSQADLFVDETSSAIAGAVAVVAEQQVVIASSDTAEAFRTVVRIAHDNGWLRAEEMASASRAYSRSFESNPSAERGVALLLTKENVAKLERQLTAAGLRAEAMSQEPSRVLGEKEAVPGTAVAPGAVPLVRVRLRFITEAAETDN